MRKSGTLIAVAAVACGLLTCAGVWATALSADRNTLERDGREVSLTASSNVFYRGAIVCENGSEQAAPGADSSGYVCIGMAAESLDNTGTNHATNKTITVRRGVFRWANGGSFTDANIGDLAYVSDDQTVTTAASATYDVVAGVIIDVDSSGVWVDTYAVGGSGAASVTTLHATGAATLDSTLSVAGKGVFSGPLVSEATTNGSLNVTNNAAVGTKLTVGTFLTVGAAQTNSGVVVMKTNLTVNGASVRFTALPTATNGLTTGDLWTDWTNIFIKP